MRLTRDDYATLEVQSAIFHDLPRQITATPKLVSILSEAVTPLNEASRQHLRSKLVDTLQSTSSYVVQFLQEESVVSASARAYLNRAEYGEPDFIARSRAFAQDLFARQGPTMSAGLLCVVACTVNGRCAIALMKIEREEGAQLELSGIAGHRTFTFELLNNLVFTKNTKLYKAGLFAKVGPEEGINCGSCDQQFRKHHGTILVGFPRLPEAKRAARGRPSVSSAHRLYEVNPKYLSPVEKNEVYERFL